VVDSTLVSLISCIRFFAGLRRSLFFFFLRIIFAFLPIFSTFSLVLTLYLLSLLSIRILLQTNEKRDHRCSSKYLLFSSKASSPNSFSSTKPVTFVSHAQLAPPNHSIEQQDALLNQNRPPIDNFDCLRTSRSSLSISITTTSTRVKTLSSGGVEHVSRLSNNASIDS